MGSLVIPGESSFALEDRLLMGFFTNITDLVSVPLSVTFDDMGFSGTSVLLTGSSDTSFGVSGLTVTRYFLKIFGRFLYHCLVNGCSQLLVVTVDT